MFADRSRARLEARARMPHRSGVRRSLIRQGMPQRGRPARWPSRIVAVMIPASRQSRREAVERLVETRSGNGKGAAGRGCPRMDSTAHTGPVELPLRASGGLGLLLGDVMPDRSADAHRRIAEREHDVEERMLTVAPDVSDPVGSGRTGGRSRAARTNTRRQLIGSTRPTASGPLTSAAPDGAPEDRGRRSPEGRGHARSSTSGAWPCRGPPGPTAGLGA